MGAIKVKLCNIILTGRNRINDDDDNLYNDIVKRGLMNPLRVEGPTNDGKYYLIDGYRRYNALVKRKELDYKVEVTVIRNPTDQYQRKLERLKNEFSTKKMIGIEKELEIKDLLNSGRWTEKEISEELNTNIKNINKAKHRISPEDLQIKMAKSRASQYALDVIWSLDVNNSYKDSLFNALEKRKITGDDAKALEKVTKHQLFSELSQQQKVNVLEETLKQSRFKKEEAELLLVIQLMKDDPGKYENYISDWINYICKTIEETEELTHQDIETFSDGFQKNRLKEALGKLNEKYFWLWSDITKNSTFRESKYKMKRTNKGYSFRKHF